MNKRKPSQPRVIDQMAIESIIEKLLDDAETSCLCGCGATFFSAWEYLIHLVDEKESTADIATHIRSLIVQEEPTKTPASWAGGLDALKGKVDYLTRRINNMREMLAELSNSMQNEPLSGLHPQKIILAVQGILEKDNEASS